MGRFFISLASVVGACLMLAPCVTSQPLLSCADVSFTPQNEAGGAVYYDTDGGAAYIPDILVNHGISVGRLRIWHTPSAPGWCNLANTVDMAKRLDLAGMKVLLDPHYSDTWADPSQQTKPAAWTNLNFNSLKDAVRKYTKDIMVAMYAKGIDVAYFQIGNEIAGGFLWDDGKTWGFQNLNKQWKQFGQLLQSARDGIDDAVSLYTSMTGPKVIIHNEHGGDFSATRWFFDNLRDKTTFTKWDIIGVSFYPWWHGELTDLEDNLKRMRTEYGKDLAVVEFAYAWTEDEKDDGIENIYVDPPHPGYNYTEQGQVEYIRALLDVVDSVPGAFMGCYWAPEWTSGPSYPSAWENLALFDFSGRVLPGMLALGGYTPHPTASPVPSSEPSSAPSGMPSLSKAPSLRPSRSPSSPPTSCSSIGAPKACKDAGCKWQGGSCS